MGSAVCVDGRAYVFGGEDLTCQVGKPDPSIPGLTSGCVFNRMDTYDFATNSWSVGPVRNSFDPSQFWHLY